MDDPRLLTEIYVQALCRQCQQALLTPTVYIRGDRERGTVVLRLIRSHQHVHMFEQGRAIDGTALWRPLTHDPVSERDADARIQQRRQLDPDIWVIDVEDPWDSFTFDAPVVDL